MANKNATNAEQKDAFAGEATNGKEAVTELQTETKTTSTEDALAAMKALLQSNPELLKALVPEQKVEQKAPVFTPTVTPVAGQENRIFLLSPAKKKGDVNVDLTDDVIDPKTGRTRRMRIIRGAQSIWQDEQTSLPKEHTSKAANQVTLKFSRGRCIIPAHETMKIQAALLSNRNLDNPNRVGSKDIYFKEWNPAKLNQEAEKRNADIIQAMQIAATADYKDLLPHARYLGVPITDEMGVPLNDQSIRNEYSKKALSEPDKFLKSIHSPVVKVSHNVRRALAEGKIDMGRQPNQAFWTDGGFICAVPPDREQVEYLTEFAMIPGEANSAFAEQLKSFYS